MDYQTITTREDGGIGIVTLARPDMMNALNRQMRAELTHALTDIASRARVLVLTGSGRAFCSGQDLGDGGSAANIDLERTLREEYEPMLRAIYDAPVPVICAVNGAAAGAGANLALAADVVIAHEDAVFIQAFSKIGLIPDAGGTWFLPRQVGFARAMGAMLFADRISAQQAVDWGMIWEAAPADSFDTLWMARARMLADGPTVAYRNIRRALRDSLSNPLNTQLKLEAHLQAEAGKTRDFKEGVLAFLEKRPASFEGR
ncbi:MAG: 2-(1,2-epoxy-1,2-dihydrophenyl)acetyl-CoA isomerase [Roseibaca calidilacus]|uniref:2-(1,2-epoxy-1,2-dihydrophenyl)acetyl-CoA isomerase n=1 Tax=Roseibaca calidilacus TaxID=1666912 RepID=A0A0P8ABT5_9RHOB|nr:enoyl-CoA hydratase-related protein [Roseibaca calidilacus]KPP91651.1 MAG: 2-(1,2-epoxy-1,2-dihydrophenyl)acetyl-CoA isomerase [Roseibaca calidilacus]CUX82751.1 2-(1,2-epoxy-1,2-dihydrophenyl)acetyl-CoA isomerase [Roseibaca calidilacus]